MRDSRIKRSRQLEHGTVKHGAIKVERKGVQYVEKTRKYKSDIMVMNYGAFAKMRARLWWTTQPNQNGLVRELKDMSPAEVEKLKEKYK